MFRFVEGDFYKKKSSGFVDFMEIVNNPILRFEFEQTKKQFLEKGIPLDIIFCYHRTKSQFLHLIGVLWKTESFLSLLHVGGYS